MSMDGATCPSLHHRKEGQPSDEEMLRSHKREAGWFSDSRAKGKPPRMRERMLREISITHPALLAVMQGGAIGLSLKFTRQIRRLLELEYQRPAESETSPLISRTCNLNRRRALIVASLYTVSRLG